MGFRDALGSIGGAAMEKMKDSYEQLNYYMERYSDLSDEDLQRKFHRSHGVEKVACANLLKQRVY